MILPRAALPASSPAAGRPVLLVAPDDGAAFGREHERAARRVIAARLARLIGSEFLGEARIGDSIPTGAYCIPSDTLTLDEARQLGVRGEDDLFGGVVPHAFVATKIIAHPLVSDTAKAPAGWSRGMAAAAAPATLPGYAAFSPEDALEAGLRLLERGAVRVKAAADAGGRGQSVAGDAAALCACLDRQHWEPIAATGLALEQDLDTATSYSVGQVRAAGLAITYYGVQRHTANNRGEPTYGGSTLLVARGGFADLLALDLPGSVRTAIEQARQFDRAAAAAWPALFASRRNYDVAQGRGADGAFHSGVLEQSWRIGGASGAEIAAMEALRANPGLVAVNATTVEIYGESASPPDDAILLYRGIDPHEGPLTKFAMVEGA